MGWVILIILFVGIPLLIGGLINVIPEIFGGSGHTTSGSGSSVARGTSSDAHSVPPQNEEPAIPRLVKESVYMDFSDGSRYVDVDYNPGDLREIKVYLDADRTVIMVGSPPYYYDRDHTFIKFSASPIPGGYWRITAYQTYDTVRYGV
ncbi:MAG: hypothetical protein E7620_06680 [Ruminococcaceae bacterium]|nr:hypothetical protein [Oscillospiraceae bacterium]